MSNDTLNLNTDELYKLIGIDEDRFNRVVKPVSDEIVRSSRKVDLALMKLDMNKQLTSIEKYYVAFCIGKVSARNEFGSGILKRLGM